MGDESAPTSAKEGQTKAQRQEREEAVRKKYDFSVIRQLRQQKRLTIEQFAKLCSLSYAPISRIETNLIKPNLDTLDKIAAGLGVSTGELVSLAERREPRPLVMTEAKGAPGLLMCDVDGIDLGSVRAKKGETWSGAEDAFGEHRVIWVRTGAVDVNVDGKPHRLDAGQSLRFDRAMPHKITALEDTELTMIAFGKRR